MHIGSGERIPAVQALSIAILQENIQKRNSGGSTQMTKQIKSAEAVLESGFNNDADVIYDKNNEILTAINQEEKKKGGRKSSSKSKNGGKNASIRLRILVGFRGKSFKVWDVLGNASKGFSEPSKGTEVRTEEAVRYLIIICFFYT